jgi:predicted nucleic acid-binding protein
LIVLDAGGLIAHFDANDGHHDRARALLLAVADEPLATSQVNLAEVLVGPARTRQLDRATLALRQLNVSAVSLQDDTPARLALLRAGANLRLVDCCVRVAAGQTGAAVATFGDGLTAAARERGPSVRRR